MTIIANVYLRTIFLSTLILVGSLMARPAFAQEQITVAYFPGWPTTQFIGAAKGWFSEALGVDVRFVQLETGTAITSAMLSGEVQIGYSLGDMPFTLGVSKGAPIEMVGVAVINTKINRCVVRDGSGVKSAKDLAGANVGLPFGTVPHYQLYVMLDHLGVNPDELELYDMSPASVASGLIRGDLDMGCAWEPAVSRMLEHGHVLASSSKRQKWEVKGFDTIAVTESFAEENPELLTKFLEVVDRTIRYYRDHPEEAYEIIGRDAGISAELTENIMSKMTFLTRDQQLSPQWLGTSKDSDTGVTDHLRRIAQFMLDQGELDSALDDYGAVVDPQYYEAVEPAEAAD